MNKKILITGTSKGLGSFLADKLKNDYEILGISRGSRGKKDIREFNISLTNFEVFNNLVKIFEQEKIELDGIILNAGVGVFGKFEEVDEKDYIEIINLNLTSQILLLKSLEKFFIKDAKIIFIGSISSKKFFKYGAVYQASKFGLRGFAGSLKNEWKDKKIFFLNPQIIDTRFHDKSRIKLDFKDKNYTKKEDILEIIINIFSGNEKRFEIDF